MCGEVNESVSHLFFKRTIVWQVWYSCCKLWQVWYLCCKWSDVSEFQLHIRVVQEIELCQENHMNNYYLVYLKSEKHNICDVVDVVEIFTFAQIKVWG